MQQEQRLALVIGNGNYAYAPILPGPAFDINLVSQALQSSKFNVLSYIDLDKKAMERAFVGFLMQAKDSDVVLVYYSGHGVQYQGANYMIPVDADLQDPSYLDTDAVSFSFVFEQLAKINSRLKLILLDACRNNPWATVWVGQKSMMPSRGLAPPSTSPIGFVIGYATSPEDTAMDGGNQPSPYATAFANQIKKPQELRDVLGNIQQEVQQYTQGDQTPWVTMSIGPGQFFFTLPSNDEYERRYGTPVAVGSLTIQTEHEGVLIVDGQAKGTLGAGSRLPVGDLSIGEHIVCLNDNCQTIVIQEYGSLVVFQDPISEPDSVLNEIKTDVEVDTMLPPKFHAIEAMPAPLKATDTTIATPDYQNDWQSPTLGLMRWISAGTFVMGSPLSEHDRDLDEVQHTVALTKGFYLMEHEVTQQEWAAVMGNNPSYFSACGYHCPVEQVSWEEIQIYIENISKMDGVQYRLPTESEWEYAARGGQPYLYSGAMNIEAVGWVNTNSNGTSHIICQKQRNGYGLCDMSGNVWEWVNDWYGEIVENARGLLKDPKGPTMGSNRVVRGGCWGNSSQDARVANRSRNASNFKSMSLGFRLSVEAR
jgi:formylglycine-generating enzyme required for sulfatase activity